jgi:hypothetical protein
MSALPPKADINHRERVCRPSRGQKVYLPAGRPPIACTKSLYFAQKALPSWGFMCKANGSDGINGQRFIAMRWDDSLPPAGPAKKSRRARGLAATRPSSDHAGKHAVNPQPGRTKLNLGMLSRNIQSISRRRARPMPA